MKGENKKISGLIPEFISGSSRPVVTKQSQQASKTLKRVQGLSNSNKIGFTLIELLVVVLIVGILAAIALPQYNRVVEKSHLQEVLINLRNVRQCEALVRAEGRDFGNHGTPLNEICPLEMTGGTWSPSVTVGDQVVSYIYTTKYFRYDGPHCFNAYCAIDPIRPYRNNRYLDTYRLIYYSDEGAYCLTEKTEMGRYICKYLETQGWEYVDEKYDDL